MLEGLMAPSESGREHPEILWGAGARDKGIPLQYWADGEGLQRASLDLRRHTCGWAGVAEQLGRMGM